MKFFKRFQKKQLIDEIFRHEKCADYVLDYLQPADLKEIPLHSLSNYKSGYKVFDSVGGKKAGETISRVNKARIREMVISKAKQKVFEKKMPYIHLAYYPLGYKNVASFRVDCDKSDQMDIDRVYHCARAHSFPITWFIEVGSQEKFLDYIASINSREHDIQLHCYHHLTYNNYRKNRENILKGKGLLEKSGVEVSGFAAPFGKWNPSLNRVLEESNFSFSSEFALGYDDLPFFPLFNNNISSVLQIPVHPICIGSLRNALYTPREMISYFERIISSKYERKVPIMLYGHPKNISHRFSDVFNYILSSVKALPEIRLTTYREFATWWLARLLADFSINTENSFIEVKTSNNNPELQLRVEMPDNKESFIPLVNQRIDLRDLVWTKL